MNRKEYQARFFTWVRRLAAAGTFAVKPGGYKMKWSILAVIGVLGLSGCAGMGDAMQRAAHDINTGVARAPDVRADVTVK